MLVLSGAKGDVTRLAFGPDAKLLAASGGGRGLEMWDLPSGNLWGRYERSYHPVDGPVAFHPTRPRAFASGGNWILEIETDTKGARKLNLEEGGITFFNEWGALPDGSGFVCQCNGTAYFDGTLRLLRWRAGQQLLTLWNVKLPGLTARSSRGLTPLAVAAAPDGRTFVTLDAKPPPNTLIPFTELVRLAVWSLKRGEIIRWARLPANTARALAIAPDSRTVATCAAGTLYLWGAADLEAKPRAVRGESRSHLTGIVFHPSGRYLAATSNDATVKLYDTATWKVARTFTWDIGRMRSIAFSPDGALAAAGSDTGKVVVWDVDV